MTTKDVELTIETKIWTGAGLPAVVGTCSSSVLIDAINNTSQAKLVGETGLLGEATE